MWKTFRSQVEHFPTTNAQIISGLCMAWCAFWLDALTAWTMSYEILLLITAHIAGAVAQHYGKRKTQFSPTEMARAEQIKNGNFGNGDCQ